MHTMKMPIIRTLCIKRRSDQTQVVISNFSEEAWLSKYVLSDESHEKNHENDVCAEETSEVYEE